MKQMRRSWGWLFLGIFVGVGILAYGLMEDSLPVQLLALGAVVLGAAQGSRPLLDQWSRARRLEESANRWRMGRHPGSDDLSSPAQLLDARHGIVPFTGRQRELDELLEWCSGSEDRRVRLLTGAGGVGKTRLAAELASRLSEAGWSCFEVESHQEADAVARVRAAASGRVLLVVDYVETRADLPAMLEAVAADGGRRIRVLLLARNVGEWWERLRVHSAATRGMLRRAYDNADLPAEVSDARSDDDLVADAVVTFAKRLGVTPVPQVRVVSRPGPTRILDLHAGALVGVLKARATGAFDGGVTLPVADVLEELLVHEQRYWYGAAGRADLFSGPNGVTLRQVRQFLAVTSLLGAATPEEAVDIVRRVAPEAPAARIVEWLRELYPASDQLWLGVLQPDRVAELHIFRELALSHDRADRYLSHLTHRQAVRAIVMLTRLAVDRYDQPDELAPALRLVDLAIDRIPDDLATLRAVITALPRRSVVLAGSAVKLVRRALDLVPPGDDALRVQILSELGMRSAQAGLFAEALDLETEVVGIRRRLTAVDPGRHLPLLARAQSIRGKWLAYSGDTTGALEAEREAIAIRESLVESGRRDQRAPLALSLTNYGNWLAWTGHPAQAIEPTRQAIDIWRGITRDDPAFTRDLAESLSHLAHWYADLHRYDHALPAAGEAVALRRELAHLDPDLYQHEYSISLGNLGMWLVRRSGSSTGSSNGSTNGSTNEKDLEDGMQAISEAISIQRVLATHVARRFPFDLAISIYRLSVAQTYAGQAGRALSTLDEAIELQRQLMRDRPFRVRPYLAHSINHQAALLTELERAAEALEPAAEAVALYRDLCTTLPYRYSDDLRSALEVYARALLHVGRIEEAALAASEAEDLRGGPKP